MLRNQVGPVLGTGARSVELKPQALGVMHGLGERAPRLGEPLDDIPEGSTEMIEGRIDLRKPDIEYKRPFAVEYVQSTHVPLSLVSTHQLTRNPDCVLPRSGEVGKLHTVAVVNAAVPILQAEKEDRHGILFVRQ
jgi:hypothetical protein